MVVVAVVAVACAASVVSNMRRERFGRIARNHLRSAEEHLPIEYRTEPGGYSCILTGDEELFAFHSAMHRKYERAAFYPWLPVEPDPPEPE